MTDAAPENEQQVGEFLRWALAEEAPVELIGNGTKRRLGPAVQAAHTLSMRALAGITLYEPEELVLRALPGTTIDEIETTLAAQNQMLAFEPPDWGPLFGAAENTGTPHGTPRGTLGGAIGCNLAGPRRVRFGAARDHILGFRAVNGRGESFKSGGRVMKNVTGYDLSKLMAGSMGTLAALTEITLKVLPRAERLRTVLLYGLDAEAANAALTKALQLPFEVTGAAFLPADIAAMSGVDLVRKAGASVAAIRLEGAPESTSDRCTRLRALLREATGARDEELHGTRSIALWREIADVAPLLRDPDATILRLSVPPAAGAIALGRAQSLARCKAYLDWGGGAVWLAGTDAAALAAAAQTAVAETGGVVQPIRNAHGATFAGLSAPDELARAIKAAFDPNGILNPGRMG